MKKMTSAEARQAFLDFFAERGHEIVASSSLVPGNDPTLLFTNSGMVQFKDVFLGLDNRPYRRATTSQKCMRITGKHNDLENVGPSPRHHTFFEMLGNFSFGDYFKQDASRFAYDLLTETYGIPPDKLYYTVHTGDDEAFDIWVNEIGIPPERVYRMGDETNFWQMADTGPCGPTSEIHYDFGVEHHNCDDDENCSVLLDNGCTRWLEIWNLVFMQYNRDESGHQDPLPAPGVDTGLGLERILSVLHHASANYETDLFTTIMDRTQEVLGHSQKKHEDEYVAYRVIADHTRAATFLIADGVEPGPGGREYITRMLIRRAWRFAHLMGVEEPFLAQVADAVVDLMGDHYPELRRFQEAIRHHISAEERRFQKTLDRGLTLIDQLIDEMKAENTTVLDGARAFRLYDTHGLPLEITRDILKEHNLDADEAGFRAAQAQHRLDSEVKLATIEAQDVYREIRSDLQANGALPESGVKHDPYGDPALETKLLAMASADGERISSAKSGERVSLILAETPFYVEAGGQVSDTGTIEGKDWQVRVDDTRQPVGSIVVHLGEVVSGKPKEGDAATASIDVERRRDITRNHTATHLLHKNLRAVLGELVRQRGSLVAPDRLRFDFSHDKALTQEELDAVSAGINDAILANYPVVIEFTSLDKATAEGAMALFDEKYESTVRTITIQDDSERYSYELCGGNHVTQTAEIGPLVITNQEASAAGVRRITAVTGRKAHRLIQERLNTIKIASDHLRSSDPSRLEQDIVRLQEDFQRAQREADELRLRIAQNDIESLMDDAKDVKGVPVLALAVPNADHDTLGHMADRFKERHPSGVAVLISAGDNGAALVAAVTDDLVKRGLHAGKLVGEVAKMIGGKGGGRPTFAKGGGSDTAQIDSALAKVPDLVAGALEP
jgi:alanyl-tRNA synthetase